MLALALILLQGIEVEPRAAAWDELAREVFEPGWILPEGVPLAPKEHGLPVDLELELARLVARVDAPAASDPTAPRCLGDLAAATRGLTPADVAAVFARTERAQPALWRALAPYAPQLLRDERLRAADWDPEQNLDDDGLLMARPLTLAGVESEPWKSHKGSRLLQQAAALVRADVAVIKEVENDYTRYPGRPGTSYESIGVVPGSFLRGEDSDGRPYAALRLRFESDLPFPFSSYVCDLAILNRIRADGRLTCDIASPSPDFHWLAGRDLYLPVHASDGTWQGELVVRRFGFDLARVPDDDSARRAGLRASLGALKREAEALARARPAPSRPPEARGGLAFQVRSLP